jgi:hypothetical protein
MKNVLIAMALCISSTVLAQSNKEDVDFIQSLYGKEKKAIVADFVTLLPGQKEAFWKMYDEYETKRKELGKKRIELLEKYANNYDRLDNTTTSQLVKETIALGAQNDKLISAYYKKAEKLAGTKSAAQFYQLESYFLSQIRSAIFESIPFIGELR